MQISSSGPILSLKQIPVRFQHNFQIPYSFGFHSIINLIKIVCDGTGCKQYNGTLIPEGYSDMVYTIHSYVYEIRFPFIAFTSETTVSMLSTNHWRASLQKPVLTAIIICFSCSHFLINFVIWHIRETDVQTGSQWRGKGLSYSKVSVLNPIQILKEGAPLIPLGLLFCPYCGYGRKTVSL